MVAIRCDRNPDTCPVRALLALLAVAGIEASAVSGHSARVGMAQDNVGVAVDIAGVMQAGQWKTPTMLARCGEQLLALTGAVAH